MPSLISQATLEAYIHSSIYEKHTMKMHQSITKKLSIVRAISNTWIPDYITLIGAKSGFYFTLKLHDNIDVNVLASNLEQQQVWVKTNEDAFYHPENYDNSIRLSVSQTSPQQLKEALDIIYKMVKNMI